jgi:S-adenosylhomocysteine hydrolase
LCTKVKDMSLAAWGRNRISWSWNAGLMWAFVKIRKLSHWKGTYCWMSSHWLSDCCSYWSIEALGAEVAQVLVIFLYSRPGCCTAIAGQFNLCLERNEWRKEFEWCIRQTLFSEKTENHDWTWFLDDGGDLTNIVLINTSQWLESTDLKDYYWVFTDFMSVWKNGTYLCLQSTWMIRLLNQIR